MLRELVLLDPDCERLVFGMRAHPDGAILLASADDLEDPIGFVAAEANHKPNRCRQLRLDVAFNALTEAAETPFSAEHSQPCSVDPVGPQRIWSGCTKPAPRYPG